jgi:hypothetical protein
MDYEIEKSDEELIRVLRNDKVIRDVRPQKLTAERGAAIIYCSDSDHSDDQWNHFLKVVQEVGQTNRLFPVPRAGGAIWVPESELLKKVGLPRDEDIFFDLEMALTRKKISTIFSCIHAPCGAAKQYGLSFFDQLELLMGSRKRLEERFGSIPNLHVKPFFHVCYPPGARQQRRRRTYFVSGSSWEANNERYRKFDYTPGRLFTAAAGSGD